MSIVIAILIGGSVLAGVIHIGLWKSRGYGYIPFLPGGSKPPR